MEYIIKYNGNLDSIRDKIEILSAVMQLLI